MTSLPGRVVSRVLGHVVGVYTLHMISQVPFPREAVSWLCTFAVWPMAEMSTVAVKSMSFTLVAEEAGIRRE